MKTLNLRVSVAFPLQYLSENAELDCGRRPGPIFPPDGGCGARVSEDVVANRLTETAIEICR